MPVGRWNAKEPKCKELAEQLEARKKEVKDAEEELERHQATNTDGPSLKLMQKALVSEGVVKPSWKVEPKEHKQGEGMTLKVGTITGPQGQTLLGLNYSQRKLRKEDGKDERPYIAVIQEALGACCADHSIRAEIRGSLEAGFCVQCNTAAIFWQYASFIYPVIRAMTWDQINNHLKSSTAGKITSWDEGGRELYKKRLKAWGQLLKRTFTNGGSRSVISDYCKCFV